MRIDLRRAAEALQDEVGGWLEDDYLPGKTQLRDALWARFDLSELEAEELVDSLEGAGSIKFTRSVDEGTGFRIELDPSTPHDPLE